MHTFIVSDAAKYSKTPVYNNTSSLDCNDNNYDQESTKDKKSFTEYYKELNVVAIILSFCGGFILTNKVKYFWFLKYVTLFYMTLMMTIWFIGSRSFISIMIYYPNMEYISFRLNGCFYCLQSSLVGN